MPGESGDEESTGVEEWGGGEVGEAQISRYHCFFNGWERKQEFSTLLLLDANLFPILSSPTGFETCQTSKAVGFDSFSESPSSEGSKRFWSAGYHVFLAKHQAKPSNPHPRAGFLTTPTVRTGRELKFRCTS